MSFLPIDIRPTQDIIHLKNQLNNEFHDHGRIQGLVSYIYYPQSKKPLYGHVKLEVEGKAWALVDHDFKAEVIASAQSTGADHRPQGERSGNLNDVVPLTKLIRSSSSYGLPFLRFHITVTPKQLSALRENIGKKKSVSCSRGALQALSKHGEYTVPLPLTLTPLSSAIYLTTASNLGSRRINKINFIRNKNLTKSIAKCMPAIVIEIFVIAFIVYSIYTKCFS